MNEQTNQQTDFANQWITKQAAIDGKITAVISGQVIEAIPASYIKQLPSAQPETHDKRTETHECVYQRTETHDWIPVTERLPEVRQWVLCQCRAGIMDVLRLTDDDCWYRKSNEIYMSGFVLAWMPLPEAYKGEKE